MMSYAPSLKVKAAAELELRRRARKAAGPIDVLTWAEQVATIVHPALGRIPFVPYPYQRDLFANYAAPRRIVLKARQVGFSQAIAIEALYSAIFEPESTILLVSRSEDLAVNLLRSCYQTYNDLRDAPALRKENEGEMGLANGSRIKSIPANRSTGRGFAARRVYLDEFAYAAYADSIYQSITPAVAQGGSLTIGSTPNGTQNLFHGLFRTGDRFERLIVPWYECPAYYTDAERAASVSHDQAAWYLAHRADYTAQQFAAEYACDFTGSGDAVFHHEAIEAATVGAVGEQDPIRGHKYLTSVDVGRRHDATVINTFDLSVQPIQRVYHERIERVNYPIIQQRIERVIGIYGGQLVIESNGVGDPVIENLTVHAQPFITTARSKVQAIQALALLLEHGRLKAQWSTQERRELIGYMWDDQRLVQDCVMSLAIGALAIQQRGTPGI